MNYATFPPSEDIVKVIDNKEIVKEEVKKEEVKENVKEEDLPKIIEIPASDNENIVYVFDLVNDKVKKRETNIFLYKLSIIFIIIIILFGFYDFVKDFMRFGYTITGFGDNKESTYKTLSGRKESRNRSIIMILLIFVFYALMRYSVTESEIKREDIPREVAFKFLMSLNK